MVEYLKLLDEILTHGKKKTDPQGVGNIAIPGYNMQFDLENGHPHVTTKLVRLKPAAVELCWFLSGSTDVADLHKYNVHIWDQWATPEICAQYGLPPGHLGPIYGKQWRAFEGGGPEPVDQISKLISGLKSNPDSRRHIVTSWNPVEADQVFVAPCHCFFGFFHAEGELSLNLVQRSGDAPIGIPFNITEYAMLLRMVAQVTGLKPKNLSHTIFDAHIYNDQIDLAKTQLKREPKPLPTLRINPGILNIFDFRPEDFKLENYDPHPAINYPVAT